jgi:hypothetical protein
MVRPDAGVPSENWNGTFTPKVSMLQKVYLLRLSLNSTAVAAPVPELVVSSVFRRVYQSGHPDKGNKACSGVFRGN